MKKIIQLSFLLSLIICTFIMLFPDSKPNQEIKKYTSLEDMWINSPLTFQQSEYDIPSKYVGSGNVSFTIDIEQAYGDMLCKVQALDDTFGGTEYIEISGPYSSNINKIVNVGPLSGYWQSSVSCMLHPNK